MAWTGGNVLASSSFTDSPLITAIIVTRNNFLYLHTSQRWIIQDFLFDILLGCTFAFFIFPTTFFAVSSYYSIRSMNISSTLVHRVIRVSVIIAIIGPSPLSLSPSQLSILSHQRSFHFSYFIPSPQHFLPSVFFLLLSAASTTTALDRPLSIIYHYNTHTITLRALPVVVLSP